jgi:FkbH-like protein
VAAIAADPDAYGLAFTLSDRFGDNGLVAVAVLRRMDGETLFIENWFMSCRVLKRGMETFTLDQIVSVAKDAGYSRIVGEYVRSSRNAMVEDHYPSLGFVCMDDGCGARYALDVAAYQPRSRNIKRK